MYGSTTASIASPTIRDSRWKPSVVPLGTHFCEGSVDGEIALERSGDHGFGYDPIFRPEGREETFAQLTEQEKNSVSHRGRAVQKLVRYLQALP